MYYERFSSSYKTIQYVAHGKVAAREVRELARVAHGRVRGGQAQRWRDVLYVPPLPPTNLRGCHLISVQYDVFVSHRILFKEIYYVYICDTRIGNHLSHTDVEKKTAVQYRIYLLLKLSFLTKSTPFG